MQINKMGVQNYGRDIISRSMVFTLIVGLTLMGSVDETTLAVNTEQDGREQNEIYTHGSANASLGFIPTDTIRNNKFPIVINNPDRASLYYKVSWSSEIFELKQSDEPKEYFIFGNDPYWIELDDSLEGDATINLFQEVNNELIEFSGTQSVKWSIPDLSDNFPTKIDYEYDIVMGFVPNPGEYTLKSEIHDGHANIEYNPSNDLVDHFQIL